MESQRVGKTGLSNSGSSHHHLPYSVFSGLNPPNTSFINQERSAFDFGELKEAIVLQGYKIHRDETKSSLYTTTARPAATVAMFPSWPMRVPQTPRGSNSSTDSGSEMKTTISSKPEAHFHISQQQIEMENQRGSLEITGQTTHSQQAAKAEKSGRSNLRKGVGSSSDRILDAKTLRRLAQNREAARKSRIRKKAYVQQLESSRIRLSQLEHDLQRARSQGSFLGSGGAGGNISSAAATFDMEYARWLDDDHRHIVELRTGLQSHLSDSDLRVMVDGYIAHYDEIFRLKAVAAKSDVFHLITGTWTTPAEWCFLWMGGFRPSELIKILTTQLEPLTEQQAVRVCGLQQSSQQAEEALSQGLDQLQQSLVDTIADGAINDVVHHMAEALGKLTNLEGFVRQADNLRQQTLHQLHQILTVRQTAKCFLVIGEYYGRLRALSSLWGSRPCEILISDDNSCQTTTDLQMVQSLHNHFSNFG